MKQKLALCLALALLTVSPTILAHGHAVRIDDNMPDAEKIRLCGRIRDIALQAFYERDRGRPMKQFEEDGSHGPRISNIIIQRIYAEPLISSPKKADAFSRATCNEMMGAANP